MTEIGALIERLRPLAEKATPGPWTTVMTGRGLEVQRVVDNKSLATVCQWTGDHPDRIRNLDYIAAANPQVMLQLLDALSAALRMTEPIAEVGAMFMPEDAGDASIWALMPDDRKTDFGVRIGDLRNIAHWRQTGKERI
jgi:hypothetical protein